MTILTNDVTTRIWWDGPSVQKLTATKSPPEAKVVGALLKVWLDFRSRIFGRSITGTCPHDPLTIAEATGSRFVTYSTGTMTVHDDATTSFVPNEGAPHRAAVRVDADDFLTWFSGKMTKDGDAPSVSSDCR
jgi:inosine-uridine nucleoside N-ribohydrolase